MRTAVRGSAAARSVGAPSRGFRLQAGLWRHPEVAWLAAAAAAWIVLAVEHWVDHGAEVERFSFDVSSWTLMVIAMMIPGAIPMARYVAFNSLWSRRHRASALFLGAYVGVWVGVAVAAWALIASVEARFGWSIAPGPFASALVGALAVGWQFTPTKQRALRRCHLREPVGGRGWAGDRRALRYGVAHGRACLSSCWAIMATMFVAQHDFHLMVPLAAVTIVERFQRRPKPLPGAVAIAFAVAASAVVRV